MNEKIASILPALIEPHAYQNSISWRLTPEGIEADGKIDVWGGRPVTVRRIWQSFGDAIGRWATQDIVPAELIVACIATETDGDPTSVRHEPDYVNDAATPDQISVGLMQTLISTAREVTRFHFIDRAWLLAPENSIQAGTAMIASQFPGTHFDPPKVACAYNAGGVYHQDGAGNRWKMRQYPIGTGAHADRFVKWFNECMEMFHLDGNAPEMSFTKAMA